MNSTLLYVNYTLLKVHFYYTEQATYVADGAQGTRFVPFTKLILITYQ